jgi:streptogramin lyase
MRLGSPRLAACLGCVLCWVAAAAPAEAARTFVTQWGSEGSAPGQFNQPSAVAVDAAGNVYVADTENNRIQKFGPAGAFVTAWGTPGTAEGQFSDPRGLAVDPAGRVYVADRGNNRIQRFSATGTFEVMWGWAVDTGSPALQTCTSGCQIGTPGTGDGQFNGPEGLDFEVTGHLWVADGFNRRVQKFTSNGTFVSKFGSFGSGDGQFNNIYDVATDDLGNIYTADANARVQRFSTAGVFVTKWGSSGAADGQFGFGGGTGLAAEPTGAVFVADYNNRRVQVFNATGGLLEKFSGPGATNLPADVALDGAGNAFVVNRFPHNVQKFSASAAAPAPLPAPVLGRTVNVQVVKGTLLVALPAGKARASATVPGLKGKSFVPVTSPRQIPVGSLLDTRKGTVRLTSARDSKGTRQTGDFSAGVFQVLQSRKKSQKGITELRLRGASFKACATKSKRARAAAKRRRSIRRLRSNAKGRFRTRGRYSSATVRGTSWTTTDRCDGTLTKVTRGRVAVRDFRRRQSITLRAGKSYLARAKR